MSFVSGQTKQLPKIPDAHSRRRVRTIVETGSIPSSSRMHHATNLETETCCRFDLYICHHSFPANRPFSCFVEFSRNFRGLRTQIAENRVSRRSNAGLAGAIKLKIRTPSRLPKAVSRPDLGEILRAAKAGNGSHQGDNTYLVLSILAATGLRISELCALRVCDVFPKSGEIKVLAKESKERMVIVAKPSRMRRFLKPSGIRPPAGTAIKSFWKRIRLKGKSIWTRNFIGYFQAH
jgi:integrase